MIFSTKAAFTLASALFLSNALSAQSGNTPASDRMERMRAIQSASITNSSVYQPQKIINGCPENRIDRNTDSALPNGMRAAIEEAQAFSDAHGGRALMVMVDGKIIHETYDGGATKDTAFVSHSLHKSVVGMTVAAAVADGIIPSYDAPLGTLIPSLADDQKGDLLLSDLMSMQSGLKLYSMASGGNKSFELTSGPDINKATLSIPVEAEPQTSFSYNNSSTQLVGIALSSALEAKGIDDYSAYLHDRIWCPLGNSEASLWLDSEDGAPHYFAGFHATVRDWAEIGEAFRLGLPDGTQFDALAEPSSTNPNYGKQVWLGSPKDGKRRYSANNPLFVAHSAPYTVSDLVFFDGFGGQRVYISKSKKLVIVRFGEVNFQYDDAIIPNLILDALD